MASLPAPIKLTPAQIASNNAMTQSGNYTFNAVTANPSNSSGTFQGGQIMPAYGTPAYNNLVSGTTLPTTINSINTSPSTEIKLPNSPVVQNQMGNIIGGNVGLGISVDPKTGMPTTVQNKTPEQLSADNLTSLLGLTPKPENLSDIYTNLESQSGVQSSRQNVNNITARINAITTQAQADQLSLTGQGRGVPEVIIGGQQAQISKEAAIKVLPLQAELAAAQNNLQLAQDRLDTLFKIRSQDVQNEYEYKKMQYEAISNIITKSEQRAYEALKLNNDRTYQEKQNNIERMDSYSKLALSSGQPQLISKINSLNPSSPTFNNDLALAVSTLKSQTKSDIIGSPTTGYFNVIKDTLGNIINTTAIDTNQTLNIDKTQQLYSGLTPTTATAVRSLVIKFGSEPIIQNFATVQDGYNFSKSINNKTTNPSDDQALIYSLAKALDPGSVVREGEYATAQKYSQSWVDSFGKSVTQAIYGTGFLSETARKNIKNTIEQKYNSTKVSYDNQYKGYIKQINNLTGRTDGEKFVRDYVIIEPQDQELLNAGYTQEQIQQIKEAK